MPIVRYISKSNILYLEGVNTGEEFHLEFNSEKNYYVLVNDTTSKRKRVSKALFNGIVESLDVIAQKKEVPEFTTSDLKSLLEYYEEGKFEVDTSIDEIVDGFITFRSKQRALS